MVFLDGYAYSAEVTAVQAPEIKPIRLEDIRPYLSLTVMRCTAEDIARAFSVLTAKLRKFATAGRRTSTSMLADGIDISSAETPELQWLTAPPYRVDGFIVCQTKAPSWACLDQYVLDTSHKIVVTFMRNDLVGVHTDLDHVRNALQRWLDLDSPPPFCRVPVGAQNAALLRGETKGLWLRGTHVRRSSKADTKFVAGTSINNTLMPFHDSTFVMGSARAAIPAELGLKALAGSIGTRPDRSQLWGSSSSTAGQFFTRADEALALLEETLATGATIERPYPLLAVQEPNLNRVSGAFDVSILDADEIRANTLAGEDLIEAAEMLQSATMVVHGDRGSPTLHLDVGLNGTVAGTLRINPSMHRGKVKFKMGFAPERNAIDSNTVREVLDRLSRFAGDLLTIYYESGHTVVESGIYSSDFSVPDFQNWDFADFTGFDRQLEKPRGAKSPQRIHDETGRPGDNSLFGWVAHHYSAGWLTCDDGPGEVADFVHIAPDDGALSLVHVKAASTDMPGRGISVSQYEVVASQALKNVQYLTTDFLLSQLSGPRGATRATWAGGERRQNRDEFLEVLQMRGPTDPARVVIIQPHASQKTIEKLRDPDAPPAIRAHPDRSRLSLLDALLHAVRSDVVAAGADDLRVIGSLT
jgi:hypothetical protein